MTSSMQVDRAQMAKAAGQLETKAQAIHQIQQTLNGQINGLMSGWKGNAAQAFYSAYAEFDTQFVKVQQALETLHGKLADTQLNYTVREDENQQATNQILNALNG